MTDSQEDRTKGTWRRRSKLQGGAWAGADISQASVHRLLKRREGGNLGRICGGIKGVAKGKLWRRSR